VNTASRLQALTRELDCQAVVSAAAVGAAGGEPGDLQPAPAQQLRGRRDAIAVWTLKD
jgi:class 3 adenylate cyclase